MLNNSRDIAFAEQRIDVMAVRRPVHVPVSCRAMHKLFHPLQRLSATVWWQQRQPQRLRMQ